ncbi:MAG: hypothetical protein AMXMBFR7_10610 [Planctomycetota bacterium]
MGKHVNSLQEAAKYSNALFYLDCENEIPVTSPVRLVRCTDDALQRLSDDLGFYGLLTDATQCVFFDITPSDPPWTKAQLSGDIWVAPKYEALLGAAIRQVLIGKAEDLYNSAFDPTKPLYPLESRKVGATPMSLAAESNDWDGTFVRMLRLNPNINACNSNGDTPLHGAARGGHAAFVERLIALRAMVNAKGAHERTPLHLAILNQMNKYPPSTDAAKLLILNHADVNAKDEKGLTPLDYLLRWCPNDLELKEMLLSRGAVRGG